jgi:Fur family peroxide stress response transcriptional regulator
VQGPEEQLSVFVERCRAAGIKATHQRTEILRELAVSDGHPDVETVFRCVRRRMPAISLDTVYRTLRLFEEKGIISRVGSSRERARFDVNTDRHHHFVCTECGRIHDFTSEELDRYTAPPSVQALGEIDRVYVELRGRCRQCRAHG